jgi:hypothetical protein
VSLGHSHSDEIFHGPASHRVQKLEVHKIVDQVAWWTEL